MEGTLFAQAASAQARPEPGAARISRRRFLKAAATCAAVAAAGDKLFGGSIATLQASEHAQDVLEDRWVPTVCRMCRVHCPLRAHVVNGVVVKVEGNPDSQYVQGKNCGKSQSAITASLYNPYRVKAPMKRTNPEKGMGVDPQWVEISWDEALDTVVEHMQPVLEEDPNAFELYMSMFGDRYAMLMMTNFCNSFGKVSANLGWHDGLCGEGAHPATLRTLGAWVESTDYEYCKYYMAFGTNFFSSGKGWPVPMRGFLKARENGMKVVVIDPVQADAARMADEWIPIRPGTDQAFVLGMIHAMVLEYGLYDVEHMKLRTNGPYLIGPDGLYMRSTEETYEDPKRLDQTFGKPLVWDAIDDCVKTWDDPTVKEYALEGTYEVDGVECHPGFQLFLDFIAEYTPEWAESECDVPAETIRRIAKEFGEAACIGQTMVFDDDPEGPYEVPYRPVAVDFQKGAQAHYHCMLICRAIAMLYTLTGASNVVGSSRGSEGIRQDPAPGADGVIAEGAFTAYKFNWPPKKSADIAFFGPHSRDMDILAHPEEHPWETELYGDKLHKRCMFTHFRNPLRSMGSRKNTELALKTVDFIWTIPLVYDEMVEMCDLLLPDGSFLERWGIMVPGTRVLSGTWWEFNKDIIKDYEALQQPAVEPVYNTRQFVDIMTEIADRMGYLEQWNAAVTTALKLTEDYALEPDVKYTAREIYDRHLRMNHGEDCGVEWFMEHGIRAYGVPSRKSWYPYLKHPETRWPVYDEFWVWAREQYKADRAEHDLPPDTAAYEELVGLPEWHGGGARLKAPEEFDLYGVHYGHSFGSMTLPMEDPWKTEYMHKFVQPWVSVMMHTSAAQARGLANGDHVIVESQYGSKVEGDLYVSECLRPDCIAIGGTGNSRSVNVSPYARQIGPHFNELASPDAIDHDPVTGNWDFCPMVKVYKA